MSRGLLKTVFGTIALVALLGSPAALGASAQIQITPAQPVPGERVTVHGSGFCSAPCSAVTVSVDGSVAAGGVAVKADGTFEVVVGLAPVSGTSTITASQTDGSGAVREATAIVRVVPFDQAHPTPSPAAAPPAATPHPPTPSEPPIVDPTTPPSGSSTVTPTATVAATSSAGATPTPSASPKASPASGFPTSSSTSAPGDGQPGPLIALVGLVAVTAAAGTALWLRRRPPAS